MSDSNFFTSAEVAKLLNISTMTLSLWRRADTPTGPPFLVLGPKTIRYRKSRVLAFIEAAEKGVRFDRRQGWPSIATKMAAATSEQTPAKTTKPKLRKRKPGRPKGSKNKTTKTRKTAKRVAKGITKVMLADRASRRLKRALLAHHHIPVTGVNHDAD